MTKEQLVRKIAENADVTVKKAKVAIGAILEGITDSLKKNEKVTFTGFGTFNVVHKKAHKGRNPKTMQPITIPAKNVPVFKAGKTLKTLIGKK